MANIALEAKQAVKRYTAAYRNSSIPNTMEYKDMKREGAIMLVEFSSYDTFLVAWGRLLEAYPEKKFLTGVGDRSAYQIVLNTEDEVTFLKLIESDLLK